MALALVSRRTQNNKHSTHNQEQPGQTVRVVSLTASASARLALAEKRLELERAVRSMISRRDKLLNYPWERQRYEQHKQKVRSAKPAIDVRTPATYAHVIDKPKKAQTEKERRQQIERENVRLLQKLGDIMTTKRLSNLWLAPRPNFLHREKLFETRPHSSLPKLVAIYAPPAARQLRSAPPLQPLLKSPNSKTARRCPTCCGRPERTEVAIPEKRIPWAPMRKSWSAKPTTETITTKCFYCGHPKVHLN